MDRGGVGSIGVSSESLALDRDDPLHLAWDELLDEAAKRRAKLTVIQVRKATAAPASCPF
jgi:hypothetical protein